MDRTILHCDCNSFFASVETLLDPSLADGPTAVCGDPESRHGIILAKNEKAKAFGVQTAETIWQAKRKCPDLRLGAPHRSEYVKFSRKCNELYLQYTDLVDPFGIDESFLDVTGSMHLFGSGEHIADELRRRNRKDDLERFSRSVRPAALHFGDCLLHQCVARRDILIHAAVLLVKIHRPALLSSIRAAVPVRVSAVYVSRTVFPRSCAQSPLRCNPRSRINALPRGT